jgi:hypothetical protein
MNIVQTPERQPRQQHEQIVPLAPKKPLIVPLAPKKLSCAKRLFQRDIVDEICPFIVSGSDLLCGRSAIKSIRETMTKTEWFSGMSQDQKNKVAEIGYYFVLEDLELMGDERVHVDKDQIPITFQTIITELKTMADQPYIGDILLRIGNIIDDGQDWLIEAEN